MFSGLKSSLIPGQQFENRSKATTQKGNAHLGLGQFDEAKECFELLRSFGEGSTADNYLKKVHDAERNHQIVADEISYSANHAENVSPSQKTIFKYHCETQARENENEGVQKTISHQNSRIEFKKSLPTYLIIAIATLATSIFLNWQFKN